MSAAVTVGPRSGFAHQPRGGHVVFERTGREDGPVVVVLGGISAHRHLASTTDDQTIGWWEDQVGPGRALDSDRFSLLSLDYLAGPGSSANSTSLGVGPTTPIAPSVQADAIAAVLDAQGVERVHAIVGASYGGMVALNFAACFPRRLDRLVVLCAAHASHPMATALRSLQRRIVRLGREAGREREGLALARGLAMTTYRTDREFAGRFGREPEITPEGLRFPVDGYLDARGDAFARTFSAEAFLALSESLDLHVVDPGAIPTPTWLLASRFDQLVPFWQVWELASALAGPVRHTILPSRYGHDAFLKEIDAVDSFLRGALNGPIPGPSTREPFPDPSADLGGVP